MSTLNISYCLVSDEYFCLTQVYTLNENLPCIYIDVHYYPKIMLAYLNVYTLSSEIVCVKKLEEIRFLDFIPEISRPILEKKMYSYFHIFLGTVNYSCSFDWLFNPQFPVLQYTVPNTSQHGCTSMFSSAASCRHLAGQA